jgi:Kelch motif protein
MQTLPDYHLDALFRSALATDAEALSRAAANESEMLERVRHVLTRRRSRRQLVTLLIAAALVTLTAGAIALAGDRLRPPVTPQPLDVSPPTAASQSAAPSASPIPIAGPGGVWIPTGSMRTPRYGHDAVRLLDGRVLVVGGSGGESDPTTAEVYDPVSGTWSATGSMLKPRAGFAPVVLLDGRVLVGDVLDGNNGHPDVYGSELYDPATGTWSATGDLIGNWGNPAVLLPDGKVLAHESVYDPASGTWTATAKRNNTDTGSGGAVTGAAAILLSDGNVLMAGGYAPPVHGGDPSFSFTDAADVYDPATGSWTEVANMHEPSRAEMATLLPDGKALVVTQYGSWEVYDPAAGTWSAVPRPSGFTVPRALLSDGTVLMTDPDETNPGPGSGAQCTAAALYDPRTESLTTASSMLRCVDGSSFTLLLDGTILVAGGRDCNGDGICVSNGAAELYVPAGVPLPSLPAFPHPPPPAFPSPTPVPTPLPPAAGPVPPDARSWTVTVDNQSSEPATLFVAGDGLELVGSATPNVVPGGTTVEVTFLFPAIDDGWIYVNPRPGDGGGLVNADQIGIPGKILIGAEGGEGWLSP